MRDVGRDEHGGRRSRRIFSLTTALALVGAIAAACSSGTAASPSRASTPTPTATVITPVSLRLDWVASWYHAPFYLALDKGYYRDAGLDVTIGDGKGSNTTGQVVAAGSDTFGLMSIPAMMLLVGQGAKLQTIAGYIEKIPEAVISLSTSNITTPKNLEGKKWGYTAGSSGENLFPVFAAKNNVDVSKITKLNIAAGAKIQTLLLGQVDFVTEWAPTQDPVIVAAGKTPSDMSYADNGVDLLGHGLVASTATITGQPDLVKRFLQATIKGINDAIADPAASVAALIAHRPAVAANKDMLISEMKGLANYLHTAGSAGKPTGYMSPDDWTSAESVVKQYLGLTTDVQVNTLFTNDLLPQP